MTKGLHRDIVYIQYTQIAAGEVVRLDILISGSSGVPIYEQIEEQIRGQILSGALPQGGALPSMRQLARELRVSVITTRRAYEELEQAGLIHTVAGKGCFVAQTDTAFLRREHSRTVEKHLSEAVRAARMSGMGEEELLALLRERYRAAEASPVDFNDTRRR